MKAVMRLIWISLFTLVFCGVALLTLQTLTKNPPPMVLKHPWAQKVPWTIVRMGECPNPELLEKTLSALEKDSILWLDLFYEKGEGKWKVFCIKDSIQTLRQHNFGPALDLEFFLQQAQIRNQDLLLNVHARANNHLDVLLDALKPFDKSEHLGIISPVRSVISEMRKSRPQWIFGADQPSIVKANSFHSLRLLGLIDLWPDFYVVPTTDEDLGKELTRRGKIAIRESDIGFTTAVAP